MSAGYTPADQPRCHAGAKVVYDPAIAHASGRRSACRCVRGRLGRRRLGGSAVPAIRRAGRTLRPRMRGSRRGMPPRPRQRKTRRHGTSPIPGRSSESAGGKDFVDFDEDLQVPATSSTPCTTATTTSSCVKRYSTVGAWARARAATPISTPSAWWRGPPAAISQKVGTTTFRPPLVPEKFGHLAGRGFEPTRHTAMHDRHLELGARMMPAGLWLRPAYYGPRRRARRRSSPRSGPCARMSALSTSRRWADSTFAVPTRRLSSTAFIPSTYSQAAGRAHALCADDRRDRRHHRRRRRLPPA